jgi:Gas vesicle synthesis protein GvpL/GvpF
MQKQRYLYALVEGLSRRWRAPRAGVGGASVEAHAVRDLMLISGPVNLPPARTPRAEAAHHDVLAGLLDSQAVLPFRFGTVVPEPDLPKWLDTRWSRMRAAMSELRGHIEMSVRLLSLDHGRERGMAGKEPSGTVLRGVAERLVERANLPVWRYYPTGHGVNVAASLAFLVPSDEVATFLARIAPVAARAQDVAVVPTGPWAAHSFAPPLEEPGQIVAVPA